MKTLCIFVLSLLLGAPSVFARDTTAGDIRIERPAVRAMVPGAKVGGGYLVLVNGGSQPDRLVSVRSDRAQSVQVHEMSTRNGIMVMRELKTGVEVPAGQTVSLMPNGNHLMFMDVERPFRQGETIKATLTFEKAGDVDVEFSVGPIAGPLDAGNDGNDQGSMAMPGMTMEPETPGKEAPQAIAETLKIMFERPEKPLDVAPVVTQGDWAIAGWQQAGRGGRALLKRGPHGWRLHLCSGDGIKSADALEKAGLSKSDAEALSASLKDAEATLDPQIVARFASFEGTVIMTEKPAMETGHGGHEGHAQ